MQTPTESQYSLLDALASIYRWRKLILILTVASTMATAGISLLIPNYYTATATFAPANEEKQLFQPDGSTNNGLYGDEDAVDRALLFANSPEVVGFMIQEFKLAERYGIDDSTPKGQDKVAKRFRKLFRVKKNAYSGIEIALEDTDPDSAARMAQTALTKIEALYRNATSQNKRLILETYETALNEKRTELRALSDSLMSLRKEYGIYDVDKQSEALAKVIVESESELADAQARLEVYRNGGRRDSVVVLEAKVRGLSRKLGMLNATGSDASSGISLERFNAGRDLIASYELQIEGMNEELSEMIEKYAQFKAQANSKAASLILLEPVQTPKVKSYPTRSLFVIGAAFLAFVLGAAMAMLLDAYRRVDWKKVFNPDAA